MPHVQGGVEKHCQELYPRLVERGFDVTVFGRKGYVPPSPFEFRGVKVIPLWTPRKKSLEAIVHTTYGVLWLACRGQGFDLLHIHAIGPSLTAPLARRLGLRLVITNHGPDYDRQKWGAVAKCMLRRGEALGARQAHVVVAVSQHIKNLLQERYHRAAVYIPNGVEAPQRPPPGRVLEAFNLAAKRYILTVGRFVPEKGFHDLLAAYGRLETDWKLAIVGDADHEDAYSRGLKKKAGQTPGVVMTGFQKGLALAELYANAGLFVLPSYHEGLPIVGLEAMSYDLPMLISDIPANTEIARPEELFEVGDVAALADKLKAFLEDPSLLLNPEIKFLKKRRLAEEFDWEVIADQTARVYRLAVGLPPRMDAEGRRRV